MARPKKPVDEAMLENLAKLHLSMETMASCLGVSVDTLERRYADKINDWRSKSKAKLANVLFDEGLTKRREYAVKMLAQKHLGYADKVESKVEASEEVTYKTDWGSSVEPTDKDKEDN